MPNRAQSPVGRRLERLRRDQSCSFAAARALDAYAKSQPAADRRRLENLASRLEVCALSFSARPVTPPGEPTRLILSHNRSCKIGVVCVPCARMKASSANAKFRPVIEIARELAPSAPAAMLTLTMPNRPLTVADLKGMLADQEAGLRRLLRAKRVARAVRGFIASVEVPVRGTRAAPEAGVHTHVLLWLIGPQYFSRERDFYISQAEWTDLWRQSLRLPASETVIVDIRRVRDHSGEAGPEALDAARRELLKYLFKPSSLYRRTDFGMEANGAVLATLLKGLYRKRQVTYGGIIAEAFKINRQRKKQKGDGK